MGQFLTLLAEGSSNRRYVHLRSENPHGTGQPISLEVTEADEQEERLRQRLAEEEELAEKDGEAFKRFMDGYQ